MGNDLSNKLFQSSLSVFDSMVDDSDFEAIGQSMPLLVELNAGKKSWGQKAKI
jgi:hypothetical protein